jgi:cobalt-zinc-cadmium efflux system membrane fusion protein
MTAMMGDFLMSVTLRHNLSSKKSITRTLPWAGMGFCLAVLLAHVAYDMLAHAHSLSAGTSSPATEPKSDAGLASKRSIVSLSGAKFKEAKIAIEPARFDRIATGVAVVGVIQANSDRQVEIRPRAAGIVREVHVVLEQKVKRGDPLVTLDSPEIGTARLNLRARQRELSTARFEAAWRSEIAANVALLIPELRKGINQRRAELADDEEHTDTHEPEPIKRPATVSRNTIDARVIEKQFADKQLGTYRGTLLQAYAEFDIASHEEQKTAHLRLKNIVGEHPALVARHTREGIQAKLEAAIEQVRFDGAQEKRVADQKVGQAEAAVVDAAQRLRILGVSENIQNLLDRADEANAISRDEDVTFYRIVAPFDGTIIMRSAVPSQRADPTDVLFMLADLRSVWVSAKVSESDVDKLPKLKDGTFRLTAKGYPNREFSARLLSVGAMVDPQTRTLSVLAQTDNPDELLKLGMFVQIMLNSSTSEQLLTVPAKAVIEIETEKYVFVPSGKHADHEEFTLRPVEVGRPCGDRVEIKSGLRDGDKVVTSEAFLLKSELILQNEPSDE